MSPSTVPGHLECPVHGLSAGPMVRHALPEHPVAENLRLLSSHGSEDPPFVWVCPECGTPALMVYR